MEFENYCNMTYSGGGWTLVLKIDGAGSTYTYTGGSWLSSQKAGTPDFDNKEARLPAFPTVPVKDILIQMRDPRTSTQPNDLRSVIVQKTGSSFRALMMGGANQPFDAGGGIGPTGWSSLMSSPSLQPLCNREGINLNTGGGDVNKVRIGIVTGDKSDCSSTDSFIGIGSNKQPVYAGNWAKNNANNGDKSITVFAYIYVRAP